MMNDKVALLIVLFISILFTSYMTFLVWFHYSKYLETAKKLSQLTTKWPSSKSVQQWSETSNYKWFARIVIPLVLFTCLRLFVFIIGGMMK
jgi:hypothetical protein